VILRPCATQPSAHWEYEPHALTPDDDGLGYDPEVSRPDTP
jgi:hypothetical protein